MKFESKLAKDVEIAEPHPKPKQSFRLKWYHVVGVLALTAVLCMTVLYGFGAGFQ